MNKYLILFSLLFLTGCTIKKVELNQPPTTEFKEFSEWDSLVHSGYFKDSLKDYRGAIDDFTRSIEVIPELAEPFFLRGRSNYSLNLFNEAILDLDKAIQIDSTFGESYYYRGLAKVKLSQVDSGCLDLARAIDFESSFAFVILQAKDSIRKYCRQK